VTRPLNYTTQIDARRTAGECVDLLADAGADHVSLAMEARAPAGLYFALATPAGRREFRLPVNVPAMQKVLARELAADRPHVSAAAFQRMLTTGHARNVAWRVCRDWLEATVALVRAEMAALDEAFVAYRVIEGGEWAGRTVYEAITAGEAAALPGPAGDQ
jgi:hypothetical protein